MKKENNILGVNANVTGRVTRARAATLRASGRLPPVKELPGEQRANQKRAAFDENSNPNMLDNPKRRAVLQDVTNVVCGNSYKSCFNATKIEDKKGKLAKKDLVGSSKFASSVVLGLPRRQISNTETKFCEQLVKTELPEEVKCSDNLNENVAQQLCTENVSGIDDHQPVDPSPPQPQRPIIQEKSGGLSKNLTISSTLGFTNIDCDHKDPQLCGLYAADIYSNMRVAELVRRPFPNFMETVQHDITQTMRGILVDWLVEVLEEYKLVPDTLYLTVYLIDRFLSQNYIERQKLQLLGITCMLIASKYEEIYAPRVEEFCFITDNTYTRDEVLNMERQVLKYFGFQLFAPTAKTFLRRFLRAAQACYKTPSLELEYLADYLVELTLINYDFLKFLPSIIAASAVFLARWTLDQSNHPWNTTLEHYSSYNSSDLKTTVQALQDLQLNNSGCPLSAVRTKYRQQKVLVLLCNDDMSISGGQ
ncbi:hypothetical protein ACFE04_031415 [Oxalis oulophora]